MRNAAWWSSGQVVLRPQFNARLYLYAATDACVTFTILILICVDCVNKGKIYYYNVVLNYNNLVQFGMRNSECGINGRYAPNL